MRHILIFTFLVVTVTHPITTGAQRDHPIRALLIVAHPDDEYEMAGTIYRITRELSGVVDQVVITDGEAGYRYSSLAARYYGVDLTDEATGRAKQPQIREEESRRAGRILGIVHQWFLNERDDRFTLNADEVLQGWNTHRVLDDLGKRLRNGHYDVVFVLLPTEDTHGGHKAASILALEAVQKLDARQRPAVVGADAGADETEIYHALSKYPLTTTRTEQSEFHFDRNIHFGFNNSLSYSIVVNWVIAEHKSQGLFQTKTGQDRFENFWIFAASDDTATARAAEILKKVSGLSSTGKETAILPATVAQ
jgi:N-acetylglucosamine malate deacetylase 2